MDMRKPPQATVKGGGRGLPVDIRTDMTKAIHCTRKYLIVGQKEIAVGKHWFQEGVTIRTFLVYFLLSS
jgi:hypothetical protein